MSLLGALLLALASCAVIGRASGESVENSACEISTFLSLRADWDADDEPCQKKLSFELWTFMKAEGSAQNPDAQRVRDVCVENEDIELVELITPKGYTMSDSVSAAPGSVVSETDHASSYQGATAITFEAFCEDENIERVTRVASVLEAYPRNKQGGQTRRHLQSTTSEAGQAHQVAELIDGLENLGCTRTAGEDQKLCIMSDSFNYLGDAATLKDLGDLPEVEVVKEIPFGVVGFDEGSAMIELAYDIASGATFKFSTAKGGEQVL
ncbi:unnamed protein product, partial [Ectocarpus fasciculatus]